MKTMQKRRENQGRKDVSIITAPPARAAVLCRHRGAPGGCKGVSAATAWNAECTSKVPCEKATKLVLIHDITAGFASTVMDKSLHFYFVSFKPAQGYIYSQVYLRAIENQETFSPAHTIKAESNNYVNSLIPPKCHCDIAYFWQQTWGPTAWDWTSRPS